jgi:hypothetical protein
MGPICFFCGGRHVPGPVGEPNGPFAGIVFNVCPAIPEGYIYEDREYKHGPRGLLHRVYQEKRAS